MECNCNYELFKKIDMETMYYELHETLYNKLNNKWKYYPHLYLESLDFDLKMFKKLMHGIHDKISGENIIIRDNDCIPDEIIENDEYEPLIFSDIMFLIACYDYKPDSNIKYFWISNDFDLYGCDEKFFEIFGIKIYK